MVGREVKVWQCPDHPRSREVWLRFFERVAPYCRTIEGIPAKQCGKTMVEVTFESFPDTVVSSF